MTARELIQRFPEIPAELHGEPVLATFADSLGPLLQQAAKPSPCSTQHDATNHYYLKLIGPMAILGYGLSTKEKVINQLQEFIDKQKTNPEDFPASLLPEATAPREVKGPGCD
jgi:hypothetical protein